MPSNLKKLAIKTIRNWCKKSNVKALKITHVHPRAYVVGKAGQRCLIVSVPWQDSEPQVQDFDRKYSLKIIRMFDESLSVGDWCATAYVSQEHCGENVAVKILN